MLHPNFINRALITSTLTAIFILSAGNTYAENSNKNTEAVSYTPSSISVQLVCSNQYMPITSKNKELILPKIEKKRIPLQWIEAVASHYPHLDNITLIKEATELKQLSDQLGFKVRSAKNISLYREAATWLGTRYRWAGNTKKGVDCSGLTHLLLKNVYNKEIDRTSYIIAGKAQELSRNELEPGDLVFFTTRRYKRINHVGVYLGDGHFIHASRKGVVVSSLDDSYYARTLKKAGRL